jgi:hypothetical protein
MTYRQWLVGQALKGVMSRDMAAVAKPEDSARWAVNAADALLELLENEKKGFTNHRTT